MRRDLYRTLDVSPKASEEEIKRAYRRLALLYHPDRNLAGAEAEELFKEANDAYSILGDKEKRRRYDLYRQFLNHSARWGVVPSPSQERILKNMFLDPRFPGLGMWLDEILRQKGLSVNGDSFRSFFRTILRFLRHIRQEGARKRRPGKRRQGFRFVSIPIIVFKKVGGAFTPFGSGRRGAGRT